MSGVVQYTIRMSQMKKKPNKERCDYSSHEPNGDMVQFELQVVPLESNISGGKTMMLPYIRYVCFGCGEAWFTKVDATGKKS